MQEGTLVILVSQYRIGFIHNPFMSLSGVFVSEMAAQTPPARLIREAVWRQDGLFLESWSEFEARGHHTSMEY